eukprot:6719568-Prymnesium_polylepis.1
MARLSRCADTTRFLRIAVHCVDRGRLPGGVLCRHGAVRAPVCAEAAHRRVSRRRVELPRSEDAAVRVRGRAEHHPLVVAVRAVAGAPERDGDERGAGVRHERGHRRVSPERELRARRVAVALHEPRRGRVGAVRRILVRDGAPVALDDARRREADLLERVRLVHHPLRRGRQL